MVHGIVPTWFFEIVRHVCLWPGVKENIRAVGNLEKLIVNFVLSRSIRLIRNVEFKNVHDSDPFCARMLGHSIARMVEGCELSGS